MNTYLITLALLFFATIIQYDGNGKINVKTFLLGQIMSIIAVVLSCRYFSPVSDTAILFMWVFIIFGFNVDVQLECQHKTIDKINAYVRNATRALLVITVVVCLEELVYLALKALA